MTPEISQLVDNASSPTPGQGRRQDIISRNSVHLTVPQQAPTLFGLEFKGGKISVIMNDD